MVIGNRTIAAHAIAHWPPPAWVDLYNLEGERPEYFTTCQVWEINNVLGDNHDPADFGAVLNTEQPEEPEESQCLP